MTVRLNWALFGAFANACYRNGRSMSDVIRDLMQRYIDSGT